MAPDQLLLLAGVLGGIYVGGALSLVQHAYWQPKYAAVWPLGFLVLGVVWALLPFALAAALAFVSLFDLITGAHRRD